MLPLPNGHPPDRMDGHSSAELRLFVSSTFRDLMPEREELVKKVFPRIRKECRARGLEFTEIDLRWGVTEEESRSGKTIRICLEEIDRCRPYFIGILGSRYGWIPGISEIEKDPEMLTAFPWLREYTQNEKSIIEMEFAHAALLRKNDSAFFYEQRTGISTDETGAMDEYSSTQLMSSTGLPALKKDLLAAGLPLRPFLTPGELGEQVFQDILTILDRDFPAKQEMTPLEHERIEHEAYARNRLQSYVANPEYYEIFEERVNSTGAPLIVWGKSGLGKSALMAYLAHEYRTRHPEAFVVQHFIGAAEGSDPEDVMRQVMMEIKERYQLSDAIPSDDNALREEFPVWLAKVHESDRLVLLIDALNQLTGIAPEMHWLPDFIPANVRLVLSTTTDSLPLQELRKRKWKELEIQPLTEKQRETIARDFLDRYSKTLDPDELHTLAMNPKSSSPLFLRTVLEELRIFGHYQSLHEELQEYMASADERELFQKVLARMERDHSAEMVRSVLTAIWASRHGLSESERMEITGLSRMALSILMTSMEYHLMQREGFHTFSHNYLREAIERRYLPEEKDRNAAHARLAEYFATREYGHRRRDEEPWQWREAGMIDALWHSLADPEMFMLFEHEDQRYHFIAYLQAFERERSFTLIAALHTAMQSDNGFHRRLGLASVARMGGFYEAATEILSAVSDAAAQKPLDDKTSLDLKRELSQLYSEKQEYKLARPLCEEVVAIIEAKEGESEELFNAMIDLSTVMHGLADYSSAERVIRRALEHGDVAPESMQLNAMQNLAALVLAQGHHEEAVTLHEQTLERSISLLGSMHPTSLLCSMNLGAALIFSKRFEDALKILEAILPPIRNTLGDRHTWYLGSLENISRIFIELRDYEQAERTILELIEKSTLSQGPKSEKTLVTQLSLGYLYYVKGEVPKAFQIYQTYLPILAKILGNDHPRVVRSMKTMSDISAALNP